MKVLFLVADGVEDLEFFYPFYRFQESGFDIDVASAQTGSVQGKHGYPVPVNLTYKDVKPDDYDLLFLAGGKSPETVRLNEKALDITRQIFNSGKVVASVCHGAQILISAGLARDKVATCWRGVKDDLIAAGATYEDKSVVVDGNLISSRMPDDLPALCREIFETLGVRI